MPWHQGRIGEITIIAKIEVHSHFANGQQKMKRDSTHRRNNRPTKQCRSSPWPERCSSHQQTQTGECSDRLKGLMAKCEHFGALRMERRRKQRENDNTSLRIPSFPMNCSCLHTFTRNDCTIIIDEHGALNRPLLQEQSLFSMCSIAVNQRDLCEVHSGVHKSDNSKESFKENVPLNGAQHEYCSTCFYTPLSSELNSVNSNGEPFFAKTDFLLVIANCANKKSEDSY